MIMKSGCLLKVTWQRNNQSNNDKTIRPPQAARKEKTDAAVSIGKVKKYAGIPKVRDTVKFTTSIHAASIESKVQHYCKHKVEATKCKRHGPKVAILLDHKSNERRKLQAVTRRSSTTEQSKRALTSMLPAS